MTLRAVEYVPRSFTMHRTLLRAALALANAFAWILIIRLLGGSLQLAALCFAVESLVVVFLTPVSARLVRDGLITSMTSGVAFFSLGCASLALSLGTTTGASVTLGAFAFAVCVGAYRALYWVPYRAHGAVRSLPLPLYILTELLTTLVPFLGGIMLVSYGAPWVLWAAAVLAALSLLSLAGSSEAHEMFAWGYTETFRRLFARENTRLVAASLIEGMEAAALFFLWPLTIFLLVGGNLFVVGAIMSATLLFSLLVRLVLHHMHARYGEPLPDYLLSAIGLSGWLLRLGVVTPIQIIAVDVFQNVANRGRLSSLDTSVFGQNADRGSFVDEYSALKEMGLAIGRVLLALFVIVIAFYMDTPHVLAMSFLVAAMLFAAHHIVARRA